jgi:opacity protein-like surface antigen
MKTTSPITVIATLLMSSAAFAGSMETATVEATVAAASPTTDFSGFYAGASLGKITSGEGTYIYNGTPGDLYALEGNSYGIYGGYNWQRDTLVYGVEVAAASLDGQMPSSYSGTFLKSAVDVKARVGFVLGRALAYGFGGYSTGDWTNAPANPLTNPYMTGMNYGIGVDYQLGDAWTVGAEYIHRKMEADFDASTSAIEADFGTLQLRAGLRF